MPELPEVQTIINDLNKKIKGDTIAGFWSDWPKAIKGKTLEKFTKEIKGRKILGARRIGKNIFIDLSGNKTLYIHLKMTGHLLVKSKVESLKSKASYFNEGVNQYIHHIWTLKTKNQKLKTIEFSDVRKFAKIVLDDTEKINNLPEIKKLGVDAMSLRFTFGKFSEILEKKKNGKIRDILMDQSLISGIGNIYASEILFDAKISPIKLAEDINSQERINLCNSIKKVLKKATQLRGTSDSDYRDTSGAPGSFQKVLNVYRREGQLCKKCGTMVKRIKIGQRSVFYCPKCQK